jgi:hypothetical protein
VVRLAFFADSPRAADLDVPQAATVVGGLSAARRLRTTEIVIVAFGHLKTPP